MKLSKIFTRVGYRFPIVNEKYHIMRHEDSVIVAELKQNVVVQFQMGFDLSYIDNSENGNSTKTQQNL